MPNKMPKMQNEADENIHSILFVCLGNICRSPIAHGIALDLVKKNNLNITIDSCGTSSFHSGEHPHIGSIKASKKHNIDISNQKSRQINYEDKKFSLIITMDENNKKDVLDYGFDANKVYKLGEFGNNEDVPDPYLYKNLDGFNNVFDLINKLMLNMFNHFNLLDKK